MTRLKEDLRKRLLDCGAIAAGFARIDTVDDSDMRMLAGWIESGRNAGMEYMERYPELRRDPALLLDGAKTIITLAFPSLPARHRPTDLPVISLYAYGEDYHNTVRRRLKPFCRSLKEEYGAATRICVDSAPVRERYWGRRSGLGFTGRNGCLIVPGGGSFVVLAEILTDLETEPDKPSEEECIGCGECIRACPGRAISTDGTIDARRCISYLTIEHRGEFTADQLRILGTDNPLRHAAGNLFGCDICREVCPHNRGLKQGLIREFEGRAELLGFTARDALSIDEERFSILFSHSPLKRTGTSGLRRNAEAIR